MSKSLNEIISDLIQVSKVTARTKALDSVKSRTCEWPSNSDDFCRLLSGLCECVRTSSQTTFASALGALDFVTDDFGKALEATFSLSERDTRPPFPATSKVVQLAVWALTDGKQSLVEVDGSLEYTCKLVRSLVTNLLQVNNPAASFPGGVAAALIYALLEFPATRPRHLDIIRNTVQSVIHSFPFEFDMFGLEKIFESLIAYFAKSSRIPEMSFGFQISVTLIYRSPLNCRDVLVINRPELGSDLANRLVSILTPALVNASTDRNSQLTSVCVECLRLVLTLIASGQSDFTISGTQELEEILIIQPYNPTLTDLLVDLKLHRLWSYDSVYAEALSLGDRMVQQVIRRWEDVSKWSDEFFIEKKLQDFLGDTKLWLSAAVLVERLTPTAGMVAMSRKFFNEGFWESVLGGPADLESLSLALAVARYLRKIEFNLPSELLEKFKEWLLNKGGVVDSETAGLAAELACIFRVRSQDLVRSLASHISAKRLEKIVLSLHGLAWQDIEVPEDELMLLRDSLALRFRRKTPAQSEKEIAKQILGKSFKFIESILGSISSDSAGARILAVYLSLGTRDLSVVRYDSCIATCALEQVAKGPPTEGLSELKNFDSEIRLCGCERHRDSTGEPRSILSQTPQRIVSSQQVSRLRSMESLSPDEQLAIAKEIPSLELVDHLSKKIRISMAISTRFRRLGSLLESLDCPDWLAKRFIEVGGYCTLVCAHICVTFLSTQSRQTLCSGLGADLPSTAVRLALAVADPKDAPTLLAPVFIEGSLCLYAIEYLRGRMEKPEFRNIILKTLVHAMKGGMPGELVSLVAEDLRLNTVVEGIQVFLGVREDEGLSGLAVSILRNQRVNVPSSISPVDVLVLTLELGCVLKDTDIGAIPSFDTTISSAKNVLVKSLAERANLVAFLRERFDTQAEVESDPKGKRVKKSPPTLTDLKIELDRSMLASSMESLTKSVLFAVVSVFAPLPVSYNLQSLVGPGHLPLVVEIMNQLGQTAPPDPIDSRLTFGSHFFSERKNEYPVSPVCELTTRVLTLMSEQTPGIRSLAFETAANEYLSKFVLPFLFLLLAVSLDRGKTTEAIALVNESIRVSRETTRAVIEAISVSKFFEFRFRKKVVFPSSNSVLVGFVGELDLLGLARNALMCDEPVSAYFLASLVGSGQSVSAPTLSSLLSAPAGSLPIVLESLSKIGVQIYSLNVSLHPSIRGLVARLRRDAISLLYEEDASAGLEILGIAGSSDPKKEMNWKGDISEVLSDPLRSVLTEKLSVTKLFDILKSSALFTPANADERNKAIAQLAKFVRKRGLFHQARTMSDFAVASTLTATTRPAVRLDLLYGLAKALWGSGQCIEAANLVTALAVSEEAGRLDDPLVSRLTCSILSRTVQWMGSLRLAPVEEVRRKYFEKALQICEKTKDIKSEIKAKIKFVKMIDPIASGASKQLLVEELTLLSEIIASGVVVGHAESVWLGSRLVSLWFGYPGPGSAVVAKYRSQLAASKCLLPLFYQTASRLGGGENNEFKKEITLFVVESAKVHPNICVPIILQLRQSLQTVANSKSASGMKLEQERAKQAELVIERISRDHKIVVDSMVASFRFYFNLAMLKALPEMPSGSSSRSPAPKKSRLIADVEGYEEFVRVVESGHTVVLTSNNIDVKIKSVESEFQVADSGKSLPKILTVVDNRGFRHKQIVKGNDDLRNDAVLQQLFSLLASDVRSYKVVPISACAGIAEWVQSTNTLGSYLVGYPDESVGAHCRYQPSDHTPATVKAKMVHARQQGKDLVATYSTCCEKFNPCMRYFFFENFPSPKSWFDAQSRFSKSVAATSMVGYIVGLGDRHPNNILLDTTTGEVVHIDYGICFDAGKFLKIPEIVPFRLTRDMVDGLGSLGAQGPFAKSCEDILVSMKANSALVTAVVEVFVVDPLFNWAVASLGSDNAQEALAGVKRKLQGFLDATDVIQLSPSAQVDRLIRSATDPRNLAQMFAGWQPWL